MKLNKNNNQAGRIGGLVRVSDIYFN